ncbi:hypothetical protein K431DRAFT_346092 [Polychaeton citri CBS 116435]|uniref:Peroxisomal membrane protein Pex17 n=1 Tax=Polychaeton citri CBS 116435 TaxID=1314669 RepID=A0A9P4Q9F7_9PEZI|nr:hypothetical protein K431DRAFT_346092 [Polychaeton citri CBS 116435]
MPADRLLATLLRSLQTYTEQQDTPRLLGTASSLLTTLQNPLNVTLLASQVLSAPALWTRPEGLRTCTRCLSVFHSAAHAVIQHERDVLNTDTKRDQSRQQPRPQLERALPKNDWIRAVVKAADEHSPRWRHLLVIGGLLLGFGQPHEENLSASMRTTLEAALVAATNLAVDQTAEDDELGQQTIALVLNHCFPLLSDVERSQIKYDRLLPVLMQAMLHSPEGLRSGYFLGAIDLDVYPKPSGQLHWPERSPSHQTIKAMEASPLIANLGPLARLTGHTLEHVNNGWLVGSALDDLEAFAKTIHLQWRQCKLSSIDVAREQQSLDSESLNTTTPPMWKLLRSTLFATVILLRSIVGRMLGDSALANNEVAAHAASQALHILRYLFFISNRTGAGTFSQYAFVNLTTVDVFSHYPFDAAAFLKDIRPNELGSVPSHPLEQNLDLFFLNTAEHFTLILPPDICEELLVAAATPYLAEGGQAHLMPIFEAAHSVMLAVFSAPQNAEISNRHIAFYVDALFKVFPSNLSGRQFRLAFTTLVQITVPPSPLSASQPMLPAVLLELLYDRAGKASAAPLPQQPPVDGADAGQGPGLISEQAVLVLTVLDTLPELPLDLLDEWLPLSADLINIVQDRMMREQCKQHFWHTILTGEMDPERGQVCHAWWSSRSGRETVLLGEPVFAGETHEMTGAVAGGQSDES